MTHQVVVLAAGLGKRMHSTLPKALHLLAGSPLLQHVVKTAQAISSIPSIVVYGHQGERLKSALAHLDVTWVHQAEQLGTGHALLKAMPALRSITNVLILYGDVPLISAVTLQQLLKKTPENAIGMVTAYLPNPAGYGRIKRDSHHQIIGIIEEKDATDGERTISEINPGIYLFPLAYLKKWLPLLDNNNAQGEYYLTDVLSSAVLDHIAIHDVQPESYEEILGVNDCQQLAQLERYYQHKAAEKLLKQGVTLYDPARLDIRGDITVGHDVVIDVNVILSGRVIIGNHVNIGAHTILRDVVVGDDVDIKSHCLIEGATIANHCQVGPFARIRPDTIMADHAHIGNFVEVKNSQIGSGSKINHLSYIGDSEVGTQVNIGAGTITCNYDGANKHKTIIGNDVHIGSDTQLVAPVKVGDGATIAAGSTIVKDVEANGLTLSHELKQRRISGWQRPRKKSNITSKSSMHEEGK